MIACPNCSHQVNIVVVGEQHVLEAHDVSGRRIAPGKKVSACTGSGMVLKLK